MCTGTHIPSSYPLAWCMGVGIQFIDMVIVWLLPYTKDIVGCQCVRPYCVCVCRWSNKVPVAHNNEENDEDYDDDDSNNSRQQQQPTAAAAATAASSAECTVLPVCHCRKWNKKISFSVRRPLATETNCFELSTHSIIHSRSCSRTVWVCICSFTQRACASKYSKRQTSTKLRI